MGERVDTCPVRGRRPAIGRRYLVIIAFVTLAACGGDDDSSTRDDGAEAESEATPDSPPDAVVTSAPPTPPTQSTTDAPPEPTTSSPASNPPMPGFGSPVGDACPAGETPALAGYDASTGEQSWITCVADATQYAVLDGDGDTVLAVEGGPNPSDPSGGTATFVAIDARDGTVLWRLEGRATSAADQDALADGLAVVVVQDDAGGSALGAVDAVDGAVIWTVPINQGDEVVNTGSVVVVKSNVPPGGPLAVDSLPPPPPGTTGTYTFIRGFDRRDGQERWSSEVLYLTTSQPVSHGMAATDGTVVAMPGPVALDAATGEELWRIETDAPKGTPWPGSNEVLLMGGQDDPLTGLDLATGEARWTADGHPFYDNQWAVGSGAVYVADETDVIAYELADGSERWRRPITDTMYVAPWTATDDAVYGIWPNLVAWSPQDGSTLWATNYPPNDPVQMTSIVAADTNVVVTFSSRPMRD